MSFFKRISQWAKTPSAPIKEREELIRHYDRAYIDGLNGHLDKQLLVSLIVVATGRISIIHLTNGVEGTIDKQLFDEVVYLLVHICNCTIIGTNLKIPKDEKTGMVFAPTANRDLILVQAKIYQLHEATPNVAQLIKVYNQLFDYCLPLTTPTTGAPPAYTV